MLKSVFSRLPLRRIAIVIVVVLIIVFGLPVDLTQLIGGF